MTVKPEKADKVARRNGACPTSCIVKYVKRRTPVSSSWVEEPGGDVRRRYPGAVRCVTFTYNDDDGCPKTTSFPNGAEETSQRAVENGLPYSNVAL